MVTQKEVMDKLDYDSETGLFKWRIRPSYNVRVGDPAGGVDSKGYGRLKLSGVEYRAHRIAWLYVHGVWPSLDIDHVNRNKLDNRIENLRLVTKSQNSRNQPLKSNNLSGVTGVYWNKNVSKWQSQVKIGSECKYLGTYEDKFEAICARMSANNKYGFHENHGRQTNVLE